MDKKTIASLGLGVVLGAGSIMGINVNATAPVYSKLDDSTIQVKTTNVEEVTQSYDLDFLYKQRDNIQAQKDSDDALRDAELVEVNKLISEAEKLGVHTSESQE